MEDDTGDLRTATTCSISFTKMIPVRSLQVASSSNYILESKFKSFTDIVDFRLSAHLQSVSLETGR